MGTTGKVGQWHRNADVGILRGASLQPSLFSGPSPVRAKAQEREKDDQTRRNQTSVSRRSFNQQIRLPLSQQRNPRSPRLPKTRQSLAKTDARRTPRHKTHRGERNTMNRKAVIVIQLVDESKEKSNQQIEKEITAELTTDPPRIPWQKKVEKVTVTEA